MLYSGDYLLSASAPNGVQEAYAKLDARLTYRDWTFGKAFVQNLTHKATLDGSQLARCRQRVLTAIPTLTECA